MLLSARGASAPPVAAEMAKVREAPKQERQAPKAQGGGVGGHRGGSRGPPPCYVQDGQDQIGHEQEGCPPRR